MLGLTSRRSTRFFVTALLTLALTATGAAGATAGAPPRLSDAALIKIGQSGTLSDLKRLSASDMARFVELSQVARVTVTESVDSVIIDGDEAVETGRISVPEGGVVPLAVVCRTSSRSAYAYNATGNLLNKRTLQIQICGNTTGTPITSHQVASAVGNVYWLGWTYNGVTAQGSALVASNRANQFAQFSFTYFIAGLPLNYLYCTSLDSAGINSYGNIVIYASPTARCSV